MSSHERLSSDSDCEGTVKKRRKLGGQSEKISECAAKVSNLSAAQESMCSRLEESNKRNASLSARNMKKSHSLCNPDFHCYIVIFECMWIKLVEVIFDPMIADGSLQPPLTAGPNPIALIVRFYSYGVLPDTQENGGAMQENGGAATPVPSRAGRLAT